MWNFNPLTTLLIVAILHFSAVFGPDSELSFGRTDLVSVASPAEGGSYSDWNPHNIFNTWIEPLVLISNSPTGAPGANKPSFDSATCACNSVSLQISNLQTSSSWFSIHFNTEIPDCMTNLTKVRLDLEGPLDKEDQLPPTNQTTRDLNISCFDIDSSGRWFTYNSSTGGVCQHPLVVRPCSNYTLRLIPTYGGCPSPGLMTEKKGILTQPNDTPLKVEVQSGSDWIKVYWDDSLWCMDTFTNYWMTIESKDPHLPMGPYEDSVKQVQNIPRDCIDFTPGPTIFDSRKCPDLFHLNPCTLYSAGIQTTSFGIYNSSSSPLPETFTIPPVDMYMTVDDVHAGYKWISFVWKLSEPRCQATLTGMRFNFTDVRNAGQPTTLDLSMVDCTYLTPENSFVFNTSFPGCREKLTILPCTNYSFELVPQIYYVYDSSSKGDNSSETTPSYEATANIRSIDSGVDWISFNWTSSVFECRDSVTGFWLDIMEDKPDNITKDVTWPLYISIADCYPDLDLVNEDIVFNTSMPCVGASSPKIDILRCSEYRVYVRPEFGSINGTFNSSSVKSRPGDMDVVIYSNSISSGHDWISFDWQVSEELCRNDVTRYRVDITSNNSLSLKHLIYCDYKATNGDPITVNTTSPCINVTLKSCFIYSIKITAEVDGQTETAPGIVNRTTTPWENVTALISNEKYGNDWIGFSWSTSMSLPDTSMCQKFLTSYSLNINDIATGGIQKTTCPRNCSTVNENYPYIAFNSSLPCAEVNIESCSGYSISVTPEFLINSELFVGVASSILSIGTTPFDGESEVKELQVVMQGSHSLELEWQEPKCRSSASLQSYLVTVNSSELTVPPACLSPRGSDGMVTLVLDNNTCGQTDLNLLSCAPYSIKLKPVYELQSTNATVIGQQVASQTLPEDYEASVTNIMVQDTGTQWISLSWPKPLCQIPIDNWFLAENEKIPKPMLIPANCPLFDATRNHFSLNISDQILCPDGVNITGLTISPCLNYTFQLDVKFANFDVYEGLDNIALASSQFEAPGAVSSMSFNGTPDSIHMEWTPTEENPQCVTGYQVILNEDESNTTAETTSINMTGLVPCTQYNVTVISLPGKSSINQLVNTEAVYPAAIKPDSTNVIYIDESRRNITWSIPDPDYCIAGYNIVINETKSNKTIYNQPNEGKESTYVVLNEGFEQKKSYQISITSYSDFLESNLEGNPSLKTFNWDSASNMINVTSMIYGIVFSLLILVFVIIAFLIYKRKRLRAKPAEIPSIASKKSVSNTIGRRPIAIGDLSHKLDWLEADSCYEMSKEFEEVKKLSLTWEATSNVAALPHNREKNRYTDILPYDHSRVKLNFIPGGPDHSDYINASYITGFDGGRNYIATQGPKPSTLNDFWRMCYEQNVKVIVALTVLEERGRVKCAQYWPTSGSTVYGNIQVDLMNEFRGSFYTVRDLLIINRSKPSLPRFTRQLHYTSWPDFGCPDDIETLTSFIHTIRSENNSLSGPFSSLCPILVHCSAGVGRTGTLIALDILMEQALRRKIIDVVGTVLKIRKDRTGMVQTEDQYHLLYTCVANYIQTELGIHQQLNDASFLGSSNNQTSDSLSTIFTRSSLMSMN